MTNTKEQIQRISKIRKPNIAIYILFECQIQRVLQYADISIYFKDILNLFSNHIEVSEISEISEILIVYQKFT